MARLGFKVVFAAIWLKGALAQLLRLQMLLSDLRELLFYSIVLFAQIIQSVLYLYVVSSFLRLFSQRVLDHLSSSENLYIFELCLTG